MMYLKDISNGYFSPSEEYEIFSYEWYVNSEEELRKSFVVIFNDIEKQALIPTNRRYTKKGIDPIITLSYDYINYVAGCEKYEDREEGIFYTPVKVEEIKELAKNHSQIELKIIDHESDNELVKLNGYFGCYDITVELNTAEIAPVKRVLRSLGLLANNRKKVTA